MMKLDYIKSGNDKIEIKSHNTDEDSNYYTLLIGENGVGKSKMFEETIKMCLDEKQIGNSEFDKIIFSSYTLFNRKRKYSLGNSPKVYISNFNSENIISKFSNLYVENVWLSENSLFNNTLGEIYRILELENQVKVNLSSITEIGYNELLNKIKSNNENMILTNLVKRREILSNFNIEKLINYFKEKKYGFYENQINEMLTKNFIKNAQLNKITEEEKRVYEIILMLKSILIDAGYKKRVVGDSDISTYFSLEEIKEIYAKYFNLKDSYITEIIEIDFQIFTMLGLDFANNLLFTSKYETSKTKQLDDLSSGEFAMITRFMELAGELESNSLILVDEPETFLNPKWINEFIYLLKTLFKNMDCHFIIASQSPFIVSNLNKKDIIKLKKERNKVIYEYEEEETFGLDYNSIIKELFNMDLMDSKLVNNYFNKIKSEDNVLESFRMLSDIADSQEKIKLVREMSNEENLKKIKEEMSAIERKHLN